MDELIIIIISLLGIIISLIMNWMHNQNFIKRYKNYKEKKNEGIIEEYKLKFEEIQKRKDTSIIENEIRELLRDLVERNVYLSLWEDINRFSKITLICFSLSIILKLLNEIFSVQNLDDIAFIVFIFAIIFFFMSIKKSFDLSKKISYWELGMEEPK